MTYREIKDIINDMSEVELDQEAVAKIYNPMTEDSCMGFINDFENIDDERFEGDQVVFFATTEGM